MKSLTQQLAAVATSVLAIAVFIPATQAADIRLQGSGYYDIGSFEIRSRYGKEQGGRYDNLGGGYYHDIEYGMDYISNESGSRSGSLSYEFWALSYYGATSGTILMTRGLNSLAGDRSYIDLYRLGYGRSLNRYRYPEQNIWEFTSRGWRFRDSLAFSNKTLL